MEKQFEFVEPEKKRKWDKTNNIGSRKYFLKIGGE